VKDPPNSWNSIGCRADAEQPATAVLAVYGDFEIPVAWWQSVSRHRSNLAQFAAELWGIGMSDEQIEENLSVVIESYREELRPALRAVLKNRQRAI
jgi:hypothetical protein